MMVNRKLHVNYVETYDVNTVVDKLTVIGFHTPTTASLAKVFDGCYRQFKKIHLESCDIAVASVAQLPVDPLGVGVEAGKIAPQDLVNPMLFKTITGDSLNALLDTIYTDVGQSDRYGSISTGDVPVSEGFNPLGAYYNLLADDSFRQAHPQQGLVATGVYPLVHEVVTTRPFGGNNGNFPRIAPDGNAYDFGNIVSIVGDNNVLSTSVEPSVFMTQGAKRLGPVDAVRIGADGIYRVTLPKCYCAVLVMPPAVQNKLFFRIRVAWRITFSEFRPYFDLYTAEQLGNPDNLYWDLMDESVQNVSRMMDVNAGSIDATGVENINLITVQAH